MNFYRATLLMDILILGVFFFSIFFSQWREKDKKKNNFNQIWLGTAVTFMVAALIAFIFEAKSILASKFDSYSLYSMTISLILFSISMGLKKE